MTYNGIALSGKAGAGKNALANEIEEMLVRRGLWPMQAAFADAVKREMWDLHKLRKEDPGGRDMLVGIGYGRRQEQPDYWVEQMAGHLAQFTPFGALPILTDMRYQNEYDWAQRSGLLVVRVDATLPHRRAALLRRGESPEFCETDHPSETQLDDSPFDLRVWNDHSDPWSLAAIGSLVVDLLVGDAELVA